MSIEQHEHDEMYKKKKERREEKRSQEFFDEKKLLRESSTLLKKLAKEIAEEFWLDSTQVESLITSETHQDLDSLKTSFTKDVKESLAWKILKARESISALSKKKRESLKDMLQEIYVPEQHRYYSGERIFWKKLYEKAKNPKSMTDEFIGLWLWIFDSTEAVILFVYNLGKWIILTPYHIFLLISKKAKYK